MNEVAGTYILTYLLADWYDGGDGMKGLSHEDSSPKRRLWMCTSGGSSGLVV